MGLGEYFADTTKDLKEGIRPWPVQHSESVKWRPSFDARRTFPVSLRREMG